MCNVCTPCLQQLVFTNLEESEHGDGADDQSDRSEDLDSDVEYGQTLGLTVPSALLTAADEVIE